MNRQWSYSGSIRSDGQERDKVNIDSHCANENETRDTDLYNKVNLILWSLGWGTLVLDLCIIFVQVNSMYPICVNLKLYWSVVNYHAIPLGKVSGYMHRLILYLAGQSLQQVWFAYSSKLIVLGWKMQELYLSYGVFPFLKCYSDCYYKPHTTRRC